MIERKDLSEDQEKALQHMIKFVSSKDRQMLLAGYAGTGKTSILRIFLKYMTENKSGTEIVCTAPTNEAVRVISKTTGKDYSKTIFSLLGLALTYVDDRDPILTQVGSPKIQEYDLVIIDECSMLDHEIVQKIEGVLRQFSYLKVIYIGDDAQLPPILDTKRGINRSIVFGLQNKVQLTEVMRTAKDNPIIGVVTDIRNNLDSPDDIFSRETIINENGDGIQFYDSRDEFMEDMYSDFCSESYKTDNNYVRGIAYTNKAIYAMNQQVRKKIFSNDTLNEYEIGENLIVDEPITERINAKVSKIIYNAGQRLRVLDVATSADDEYGFRIWDLRVVNYEDPVSDQVKRTISVIFKEDVNLYYAALTELANKAKSKLLKQIPGKDGTMRNAYTKSEAWSGYFNFKEGYSWVKYSYCLTSHKCVHPDTIINTRDGYKRMKSITPSTTVQSTVNDYSDVNFKSVTKHEQYIKLITNAGYPLICGLDHPICIFDGFSYKFKLAHELTTNDYICINTNMNNKSNIINHTLPEFINNKVDTCNNIAINSDMMWVIGALVGDGCYTYKSNRVDYTAPSDIDLLDFMYSYFVSVGYKPKYLYRNGKKYTVMLESINFRNILNSFGIGRESSNYKYVYDNILKLPDQLIASFLSGLFDSDGNIDTKRNSIRFTSSSDRLIYDVQVLLLKYNIVSYVYKQNDKHYTLCINSYNVDNFKKYIGVKSIRKSSALANIHTSNKCDNYFIPYGKHIVSLFYDTFKSVYPNTKGIKNCGLNSPKNAYIGTYISKIKCGRIRLTNKIFNILYNVYKQTDLVIPILDEINNNNYFYSKLKSVELITGDIELMEIEVDKHNTYYANGIYVHNSQGSTVQKVYAVERDLNRLTWDDKQRNQLKYVAFTRASNKLNILQ